MPALLVLPPTLTSNSFPRDKWELERIIDSLGRIAELIADEEIRLVATEGLMLLAEDFCWEETSPHLQPQLMEIYRYLALLMLNSSAVIYVSIAGVAVNNPHPLPRGTVDHDGEAELWREEMSALLVKHDRVTIEQKYFIGVACDRSFSGSELNVYDSDESSQRRFPLVGPTECVLQNPNCLLIDAYEYRVPHGFRSKSVSFTSAKQNCSVIGASNVIAPSSGSHYKVEFPQSRPWTLDSNHDPVLDIHLRELVGTTGMPLEAIKYALIEGKAPPFVLRLDVAG